MSVRRLVVLAALTAILGALVIVDRWRGSSSRSSHTAAPLLTDFDRRAVRSVAVELPEQHFRLELTAPAGSSENAPAGERRWSVRVLAPSSFGPHPARPSAVEALLAALDVAEIDRRPPQDAVTGLERPAASLAIDREGAAPIRLELGARDVSKRGVFVRVQAPQPDPSRAAVVVVASHLADVALRDANEYRDARLLPDPRPFVAAAALDISDDTGASRCQATAEDGIWQDRRRGVRLDREAIERLLQALASQEASAFVTDGTPPTTPLAIAAKAMSTTTLRLVAGDRLYLFSLAGAPGGDACPADQHRGSRSLLRRDATDHHQPEPFCVAPATAMALLRALAATCERDSQLVAARPEEIRRVEITSPGAAATAHRIALERDGNGAARWQVREPHVAWSADEDAVTAWLHALAAVQLVPCPATASPPARSAATLTIETAGGGTERTRIDPIVQRRLGVVAIARSDETSPACVAPTHLASLQPDLLRFRDRRPLRLAEHDLVRVRLADAGRPVLTFVRNADGGWTAAARGDSAKSALAAVDIVALHRLIAEAANLQVDRYLGSRDLGSRQLGEERANRTQAPTRTIDLGEAKDGAVATHRIEIRAADAADGTCFGRLATGDVTFVLAAERCQRLLGDVTAD